MSRTQSPEVRHRFHDNSSRENISISRACTASLRVLRYENNSSRIRSFHEGSVARTGSEIALPSDKSSPGAPTPEEATRARPPASSNPKQLLKYSLARRGVFATQPTRQAAPASSPENPEGRNYRINVKTHRCHSSEKKKNESRYIPPHIPIPLELCLPQAPGYKPRRT